MVKRWREYTQDENSWDSFSAQLTTSQSERFP